MTVAELLNDLQARGAVLTAVEGRLRITAPVGAVTSELRAALTNHKPALLALLNGTGNVRPDRTVGTDRPQPVFRFADGDMAFGDICAGWTPFNWAVELRRKAERCDKTPDPQPSVFCEIFRGAGAHPNVRR